MPRSWRILLPALWLLTLTSPSQGSSAHFKIRVVIPAIAGVNSPATPARLTPDVPKRANLHHSLQIIQRGGQTIHLTSITVR